MNVQVSDEDIYLSRNMTSRSNLIDVSQFANKIVKERIWINLATSKIEFQPLDTDTDARSHWKHSEKTNLPLEYYTRIVPDEMRAYWKLLLEAMTKRLRKKSRSRSLLQRLLTCHENNR